MNNGDGSLGLSVTVCAVAVAASLGGATEISAAEQKAVLAVGRYCNASWNNARIVRQDWADCTQETFMRLLKRVSRQRLTQAVVDAKSRERRELNRCIWCTVQKWRRSPQHYSINSDDVPDRQRERTEFPQTLAEIRQTVQDSATPLTPRQRKILTQWMDGGRVAEIAESLSISPERVSDEKYKAVEKLRRILN